MKRILQLISQLEEGGAQRMLSYVVSHSTQYEMEVASLLASEPGRMMPFFRSPGVPVHFLSRSSDFYAPEILRNLEQLIQERKYDVVHCWLFQSIVQGTIVCRNLKVPCIADPQIMAIILPRSTHRAWEKFLIKRTLRNADVVVFNSTSAAVDFLEAGIVQKETVRVVRSGVDCEYFTPSAGEGNSLICIGRVAPEKGYEDLMSVVTTLKQEFPELRCLAAGTGASPDQSAIEFVGHVDDVRSFLAKGCIYITTSHVEGLSNALLEAQAWGLPAVARKIGPNAEVIQDGHNGYLCATIEEFVQSVRKLWTNTALRKTMGKNARERIESRFAIVSRVKDFESLYSELL